MSLESFTNFSGHRHHGTIQPYLTLSFPLWSFAPSFTLYIYSYIVYMYLYVCTYVYIYLHIYCFALYAAFIRAHFFSPSSLIHPLLVPISSTWPTIQPNCNCQTNVLFLLPLLRLPPYTSYTYTTCFIFFFSQRVFFAS